MKPTKIKIGSKLHQAKTFPTKSPVTNKIEKKKRNLDNCSNSNLGCVQYYREQTEVYAMSVFNNLTIKIRGVKRESQH